MYSMKREPQTPHHDPSGDAQDCPRQTAILILVKDEDAARGGAAA